jgi:hypothetical protein
MLAMATLPLEVTHRERREDAFDYGAYDGEEILLRITEDLELLAARLADR